jgi:hypothetical protein
MQRLVRRTQAHTDACGGGDETTKTTRTRAVTCERRRGDDTERVRRVRTCRASRVARIVARSILSVGLEEWSCFAS